MLWHIGPAMPLDLAGPLRWAMHNASRRGKHASSATAVTAALVVIGDEILSGRTKDVNIGATADFCTELGIELTEVRIVPDVEDEIVAAVNAVQARYTYVFTTGGIGPTHDDITADAVAKALRRRPADQPRSPRHARGALEADRHRGQRSAPAHGPHPRRRLADRQFRQRRARLRIGNVHVMAGVPKIMLAMLEAIAPTPHRRQRR